MNFQEKAKELSTYMQYHAKTEEREAFYSFKIEGEFNFDDKNYKALSVFLHTSEVDEDTTYTWLAEMLEYMADNGEPSQDEISEYADQDTPIYYYDINNWLTKSGNQWLVDEAVEELGHRDSISADIQQGYYLASERFMSQLIDVINELVDEEEEKTQVTI